MEMMESDDQQLIQLLEARIKRRCEQNRRSVQNYRDKNRERLNKESLAYYQKMKEDTDWLSHLRQRQRNYQKARRERLKSEKEVVAAGRWVTIQKGFPMLVMSERECYVLNNQEED